MFTWIAGFFLCFYLIMTFNQTIKLLYKKKWLIFWLTVLGAVLAFDLAVIQTPQYKASSKILVIQKQVSGQDIYSISKSAQYLSRILKEGIYSDSFFEKVIESPYEVKADDFSSEVKKRRKEWQKDVEVSIVRDLSIMEIDVFHPQREKAEQINQAIVSILIDEHRFYHGGGENVELEVLDYPLVNSKPSIIYLWISLILGALAGFLISISWVLGKEQKHVLKEEASSLDRNDFSI